MSTATQRAPRKCSLCRQEGCNKSKPTCPARVGMPCTKCHMANCSATNPFCPVRMGTLCSLCYIEGCSATNPFCPIKTEIHKHRLIIAGTPRPSIYFSPVIDPNLYFYITSDSVREKYRSEFKRKITEMYVEAHRAYVNSTIAIQRLQNQRLVIPSYTPAPLSLEPFSGKVKLLSGYKECTEECGVCYDKTCELTFNCNHQLCGDCFNGILKSRNTTPKCPFCRGNVENVQACNDKFSVNLTAIKC
jgi:hypothetical protein